MSQVPPGLDLWTMPFVAPPEGVISNFHKKSPLLDFTIAILAVVLPFMIGIATLRVWAKYKSREPWKPDDWFTIATCVITVTQGVLLIPMTKKLGFHVWDIPLGLLLTPWPGKMTAASAFITNFSLFLGKCCILSLYYRIFRHITLVHYQIYSTIVLTLPILVASVLIPIWTLWKTVELAAPKKLELSRLTLAVGITKLVVDVVILYIPIPIVLRMNLSRKKKIGIMAIFLTGSIAIVADIIDLYFRIEIFRDKESFIYGIVISWCGFIESGISVIVASVPTAAKIWKRHVVGCSLYNFVRSKSPDIKTPKIYSIASDLKEAKEKANKRRRWGLYSIPTFLTTNRSTTQARQTENQDDDVKSLTSQQMIEDFRVSLDKRFGNLSEPSLKLNDPSGSIGGSNMV